MMKRLLITVATALLAVTAYSQDFRAASAEETEAILASVELSPSEVGNLKCNFTQTRRTALLDDDLVTKGRLVIDGSKTLTWEVTSPYKSKSTISLDSDKRLQAMSRKNDFSKKVYVSDKEYKVEMTPLKRDLKQLFTSIEARINRSTGDVLKVVLTDAAGDTTTIEFHEIER